MDQRTRNAIVEALRLIGHHPDRHDADAVYGTLLERGIHLMSPDEVTTAMFNDRCDFECSICHPEDRQR